MIRLRVHVLLNPVKVDARHGVAVYAGASVSTRSARNSIYEFPSDCRIFLLIWNLYFARAAGISNPEIGNAATIFFFTIPRTVKMHKLSLSLSLCVCPSACVFSVSLVFTTVNENVLWNPPLSARTTDEYWIPGGPGRGRKAPYQILRPFSSRSPKCITTSVCACTHPNNKI